MISKRSALWDFRPLFQPVEVPPEIADEVQRRQIHSVEKLAGLIALGNIISLLAVLHLFWSSASQSLLMVWAGVLACCTAVIMIKYVQSRFRPSHPDPARGVENVSRQALLLGVLWGLAPVLIIPVAKPMEQMAVGIILVGLMFSGGFLLGRIPRAAVSFAAPIASLFILSLQFNHDPQNGSLSILTLVYVVFLAVNIRWTHRQFIDRVASAEAVSQQSGLIGLLLKDFDESTSDWLWQTDEDGELAKIPTSIGTQKSEYTIMREGSALNSLFVDSPSLNILKTSMDRHDDFKDLVLQVKSDRADIWWSITGKPVYENGFFAGFRGVASDVTQSKETEDRIAYMAHYDGLTGLPNRATFHETLEKAIRKPANRNTLRAIIWLDLDKFKWVNDTLGHPAGDELLKIVAERITSIADNNDVIARLGGDEFALSVERSGGQKEIEAFVEQLSGELGRTYNISGSTVNCSASIGVKYYGSDEQSVSALLKHADLALYHAKESERGTWSVFEQFMEDEMRARREMEIDLRRALDNDELRVHFQPLVNATTHTMTSCETLLRWQHPERGLIMPGAFIEYAEDCGLITQIGDWVIKAALENAARLPAHIKVGINISPLQILSTSLMPTVFNAVAKNKVDPKRIELEITESVLMSNTEFTLERLHQLKEMGFRIALDDFGTGYSSLSYLHSFPFDKIKIDKCFVSDLETNDDSRKITTATLSLAQSLGLWCTAEGIETQYQADFLRDHGCDELQGYFFSKPKPIEELSSFVDVAPAVLRSGADGVAEAKKLTA